MSWFALDFRQRPLTSLFTASHFASSSRAPAVDPANLSASVEGAVSSALEKKMAEVVKAELGREIAAVIQSVRATCSLAVTHR